MAIITILAAEAIRRAAKATCKELITLFHGSWIVSARITVMEHGSLHSNEETLFCVGSGEFVRVFKLGILLCEAQLEAVDFHVYCKYQCSAIPWSIDIVQLQI